MGERQFTMVTVMGLGGGTVQACCPACVASACGGETRTACMLQRSVANVCGGLPVAATRARSQRMHCDAAVL